MIRQFVKWAASSEFVSSNIPSWQILTAHAQPFRKARDLAFCLKVPLDSLFVWASSGGSGETARMRRLAWTFGARIGDKYQIRLTRSNYNVAVIQYLSNLHNTWLMARNVMTQSVATLFSIDIMSTFKKLTFTVYQGYVYLEGNWLAIWCAMFGWHQEIFAANISWHQPKKSVM